MFEHKDPKKCRKVFPGSDIDDVSSKMSRCSTVPSLWFGVAIQQNLWIFQVGNRTPIYTHSIDIPKSDIPKHQNLSNIFPKICVFVSWFPCVHWMFMDKMTMEPWAPHGADSKSAWRLCSCSVCARWENPGVLPGAKRKSIKEPKYQRAQENMGFLSRCMVMIGAYWDTGSTAQGGGGSFKDRTL